MPERISRSQVAYEGYSRRDLTGAVTRAGRNDEVGANKTHIYFFLTSQVDFFFSFHCCLSGCYRARALLSCASSGDIIL